MTLLCRLCAAESNPFGPGRRVLAGAPFQATSRYDARAMQGSDFGGADRTRTLADVVAPFGRLPATAVLFIADALLESVDRAHASGQVGLDFDPGHLSFGIGSTLTFGPPAHAPPYLLAPERARGEGASVQGDLFSAGALLLLLLTGTRTFDGGTPQATAQRLLGLKTPPPVFSLAPSLPGVLEQLLLGLLQPQAPRRFATAQDARAVLADAIAPLGRRFPGALDKLVRDPSVICGELQQAAAEAEAARGQALVASPPDRQRALVALLRSHALVAGQPAVMQLLSQAAAAGAVRGATPRSAALEQALAAIHVAEPSPSPSAVQQAAELHLEGGDLLEALGLLKRALAARPDDTQLAQRVDALTGPFNPDEPFAAGGAWVQQIPSASAMAAGAAPFGSAGVPAFGSPQPAGASELGQTGLPPVPSDIGALGPADFSSSSKGLLHQLGQLYGNLDPRARLFIMVSVIGGLSSLMILVMMSVGISDASGHRAQMHRLAAEAADCQPGGKQVLLKAYTAARLGQADVVEGLISNAEVEVPLGTRCQRYGMELMASARMARK
jgi:hypothetical protein